MNSITAYRCLLVATVTCAFPAIGLRGQAVIGSGSNIGSSVFSGGNAGNTAFTATPATAVSSLASTLAQSRPLVRVGPFAVRPHLSYEVIHGTGILLTPGAPEKITMHTLSAGMLVEAGKQVTADYTLSRVMYSTAKLSDTTNHNFRVQAGVIHDDWKLDFSGNAGSNRTVLVETGGQTQEDSYSSNGRIAHPVGRRSELEINLSHSVRSTNPIDATPLWTGIDLTLWGASTWLRHHLSDKLNIAVGVGGGYDKISNSPDMSHSQPQVQLNWTPTKKISFNAEVGRERRRARATHARTQNNTRYTASLKYSPFSATILTIDGTRSVDPSYFLGLTSQSTGWDVGLQQRFLTKLFLSVTSSHRETEYKSAITAGVTQRNDRYDTFRVRISTSILRKALVALSYQRSNNRSNDALFEFTSNQVGAEISYRF